MTSLINSKTFKVLFLGLFLSHILYAYQQPSKIENVTVYLDGAEITRTSKVLVKPGKSEINFSNLSPYIDESSIQISGLKDASILSIKYGINYLSKQEQNDSIKALQQEVKKINLKILDQYNFISGYEEELSLIQNNKRLGNETEVVSLEKLKAFAEYYRSRITEIKKQINNAKNEITLHEQDVANLNKQLTELNINDKEQTGEIQLKLHSDSNESLQLVMTYNVSNAGWFPVYDIKAEKINTPIGLEYKAHIFQNSGCNWDNVKLTLSTGDPNTNNVKPSVNPKFLNFINSYSHYSPNRATRSYNYKYNPLVKTVSGVVTASYDGLPLPGVNVIIKGTSNGTQTDFDGRYSIKVNNGEQLIYSFVGMKTEELPIHSSLMNVSMDEDLQQLEEVVVAAYSKKREKHSSASVSVRGSSAMNSSKESLYIIDGEIVDQNAFMSINPNDIATYNVLKNGQAVNIYGNRASNGAIVITTKNKNGIVVDKGITNTQFKIEDVYSIPSDGDITVIEIDSYSLSAKYKYFSAPILNENVFLTATISDWEQLNLLPAEANVYFEGSYSGKTNINPMAISEDLVISLGVDPNIVVSRTQTNDYKKNTFIGNNKVIYKDYEIKLKNNKDSKINISIVDRIPISQNRAIKVDDIDYGASTFDDDKRILKWDIDLNSNTSKTLNFSYSVKYPKQKRINI